MAITVIVTDDTIQPNPVTVARDHKVNWRNDSSVTITVDLPDIFSPSGNPTIAPGATSRNYTVKSHAQKKSYAYQITPSTSAVPRNGTIDVD